MGDCSLVSRSAYTERSHPISNNTKSPAMKVASSNRPGSSHQQPELTSGEITQQPNQQHTELVYIRGEPGTFGQNAGPNTRLSCSPFEKNIHLGAGEASSVYCCRHIYAVIAIWGRGSAYYARGYVQPATSTSERSDSPAEGADSPALGAYVHTCGSP